MNTDKLQQFVNRQWDESILPVLQDYVRIPNKSPSFDPDWAAHGHMDRAIKLAESWCREQGFDDARLEIMRLEGRTPLLFMEIPGDSDDTVLLYGHLDKQPEFSGWEAGLSPWEPVMRGDKLYGRGGADDGYAVFASLTALRALREQNIPHSRCVVVIECCEESGSDDLPHYIDSLGERIGNVSLVVCLDAECGNYDQLWCTTSLRGNLVGTLTVNVLTEGVHSGAASGVVPGSFRIIRELLARVEDAASGDILLDELHVNIPEMRQDQAASAAAVLKDIVWQKFPFAGNTRPIANDPETLLLNNTWRPALAVTGAEGLPELGSAGNVLRPETTLKLSFRLPPTADAAAAATAVKATLEKDPPYGAKVSFECDSSMGGWNAPAIKDWLAQSMAEASREFFGADAMYMGTGGSIPFMGLLGEKFPESQFLVTGLLGPKSNAHGPNEFLHIPTAKKLTACVARVVADHLKRS
ncbi:MAG TPA: M20 family metallopeptidase [Gammaproteobacteria bacterium]|nr:M20 family metallopeptidase [Gammaproteobacteria bacterium]